MGNPAPAVAATPHAVSVGKLRAVAWAIARAPAVGQKQSKRHRWYANVQKTTYTLKWVKSQCTCLATYLPT